MVKKFTIPGSGESGLNIEGVPWEFLLPISTPKIFHCDSSLQGYFDLGIYGYGVEGCNCKAYSIQHSNQE